MGVSAHLALDDIMLYNCCRYIATIDGEVNKRHLIAISEGTVIEGIHCTPDLVELLPKQPDISRPRLRIVVLLSISQCSVFIFLTFGS